jgi:hypothetical protein
MEEIAGRIDKTMGRIEETMGRMEKNMKEIRIESQRIIEVSEFYH